MEGLHLSEALGFNMDASINYKVSSSYERRRLEYWREKAGM